MLTNNQWGLVAFIFENSTENEDICPLYEFWNHKFKITRLHLPGATELIPNTYLQLRVMVGYNQGMNFSNHSESGFNTSGHKQL